MRTTSFVWLRRILLLLVPLVLVGVARKVHQLQEPIEVRINSKNMIAKTLLARLSKEVDEQCSAQSIKVESWFKSAVYQDVDVTTGQIFLYNRHNKTLDYSESNGPGGYGWSFGKVNDSDISFLAGADVGRSALYLSPSTQTTLIKRGCVVVEKSLP